MYELVKWTDNSVIDWKTNKEVKLTVSALNLTGREESLFGDAFDHEKSLNEGIDATNIVFATHVKAADKADYIFAIISGLMAAVIDYEVVGKTDLSHLEIDLNDKDQVSELLPKIWKMCGCTSEMISEGEKSLNNIFKTTERKIQNASNYAELVKDFAKGLSYRALLCSIFEQLTGVKFGLNDNGKLCIQEMSEEEKTDGFLNAIKAGFLKWLLKETYRYSCDGKFVNEEKDVISFINGMEIIKKIIKSLASSNLFKNKDFNSSELEAWVIEQVNKQELDENDNELGKALIYQAIPVSFNKSFVRAYYLLKRLITEIKEREVKSLEGLRYIDITSDNDESRRILARLDAVSTGVFGAINVAYSVTKGTDVYFKNNDIKEALFAFAANINVVNIFEFVTVVRTDAPYVFNDIQEKMHSFGIGHKVVIETYNDEIREQYLGLNKVETRILYSLELHDVEEDIRRTRKNEIQIVKGKWKDEWKEVSKKSLSFSKLFEEDEDKVYAALKTHASGDAKIDWLYRIVLELGLFKPYFQLSIDKEVNKEYKNLKATKFDYLREIFIEKQDVINLEFPNVNYSYTE